MSGGLTTSVERGASVGGRWIALGVVWAFVVVVGFAALLRYKSASGAQGAHAAAWPASSRLPRQPHRATLLMFVHPRCTCSRASLTNLAHLLTRVGGAVDAEVVFVRPRGAPAELLTGDLRRQAAALPGVRVVDDAAGVEADRFGAATSGTTLLFDTDGRLAFAGGMTSLRGHEGASFGEERIVALLDGRAVDRHDSPVFGCELSESQGGTHHEP